MNRDAEADTLGLMDVHSLPRTDVVSSQEQRGERLALRSLRGGRGRNEVRTFFQDFGNEIESPVYALPG